MLATKRFHRQDLQAEAFDDLRIAIRESVSDDGRQIEALAVVDALESDVESLTRLLVGRREAMRELNADYDATRDDFNRFMRESEARILNSKRLALERRQDLLATLKAEEWASLTRAETRAMKSIARSVRGI